MNISRAYLFAIFFFIYFASGVIAQPVTVLAPNQPSIDAKAMTPEKNAKKNALPNDEVDVLITMLEPFEYKGMDMDMPNLFAVLYYPIDYDPEKMQPKLTNLLGDVEEIRYLDKKSWGANVAVKDPGLYQFIMETKPWWDEANNRYLQQQVKVILPVLGGAKGWDMGFGQSFEILPMTRPFGLTAPVLFSGRLLLDGRALDNVPVFMGRINDDHKPALSNWHKTFESRSGANGEFSFLLNQPGWWYCEARLKGAPLKGPDGQMRDADRSTVLWLYVDAPLEKKSAK